MLRTASPNISIITNFGCDNTCWYCVWRAHRLRYCDDPTDWKSLGAFLEQHQDKGKVSISGGGDPLYRYGHQELWWNSLINTTRQLKMLVDIHTRVPLRDDTFWSSINLCALSSDNLANSMSFLLYLYSRVKTRIVHVVTPHTTDQMVEDYLAFCEITGMQLTLKELVGFTSGGRFKELQVKYPDAYFLPAGDYNIYYMPDNTIQEKFI